MFLVHPSELEQKRGRCTGLAAEIVALPRETVIRCNLCSSDRNVIVSARDRYGLPFRTAMCLHCGLLYLVDRLTEKSYDEFYRTGTYRTICSQFNATNHNVAQIQADQLDYSKKIIRIAEGYLNGRAGGRLLDVGGSTGIVCHELAKHFNMLGTVIDPSEEEAEAARTLGLNSVVGLVENWQPEERFDVVLLCRSIEHVADLRKALSRIRELMRPDGLLFCDIAEFMESCRLMGPPETVTKVDHCYWLTQETAAGIFGAVGFEIVSMNVVCGPGQVGFLLRPCEPRTSEGIRPEQIQAQVRELQEIASRWQAYGGKAFNAEDLLRRKAYRAKRWLQRGLRQMLKSNRKQEAKPVPAAQNCAEAGTK